MKKTPLNLRGRLMLFTACTVAGTLGGGLAVRAQTATGGQPVVIPENTVAPDLNAYQIQKVKIIYKKLLLKQKDIANAISVLTPKDVEASNPTLGSIQTLLTLTPSVVAYTQGPGQNAPTLAVRGIRNDELAETLDGIPLSDLLGGTGDYLTNNIGSPVTLNEIDGVTVLPGVAPPDQQGFNTIGGTIAYTTKQPTADRNATLEAGFGSFDTQHYGFTFNTGALGGGDDAVRALMLYDQSETAGFVSNTPAHYRNFMLNVVKPYDNGLSKLGLVIIYNTGQGLVQTTPTPLTFVQQKFTYNFPINEGYFNQSGQFLTTILSDETYINEHAIFNGSLFFEHQTDQIDSFSAVNTFNGTFPYAVNVQAPYNFFGPVGPSAVANGLTFRSSPGFFTYDPLIFDQGADPTNPASYEAGETSEYTAGSANTIGADPKITFFLPDNTITLGGLIAKVSSGGDQYLYGSDQAQENQDNGYDSLSFGGGTQRSVYLAFLQDKIDLLNNHLHILPGVRVTGAYTSVICQECVAGYYLPEKLQNYTKEADPYLGISYDLPDHFVAYASYGKGSQFSPAADYGVGLSGLPGTTEAPTPQVVHLYEGGIRYDTPRLYLNADYFYQKVNDAFSFYNDYLIGQEYYANTGAFLVRGLEGDAEYRVTPNLSIFANGSYNNTDYLNNYFAFVTIQEDQFGYAFQGTPFSNVPSWNGNIGIDYDNGPFSARLSGQYTGREYETYDILTPSDPTSTLSGATVTNTQIENPANFVVNLLLSYDIPVNYGALKTLNVTLNAQNLLNEHYYTYAYSSEIASGGVYSILPPYKSALIAPPQSFTVDFTAKF